ncbi:MAG: hypothetical protein IKK57_09950 [Clostridia bacterium]|nr:hypothetical protein [Clostridia bacterium]
MTYVILMLSAAMLAMLLPVSIQTDIHHGDRRLMRIAITCAGLSRMWHIETRRSANGREVIVRGGLFPQREPRIIHPGKKQHDTMKTALHALWQNKPARRFLHRHIHTRQFDVQLLLHTPSAAGTALATGSLRVFLSQLNTDARRISRIRILPAFLHDHSLLQARCIFTLRLGTILITAALYFLSRMTQGIKREAQTIWNIPSEP